MKHLLLTIIAVVVLVGCGPSVDIHRAANTGNIEAVKQHIAAGTDLNAKLEIGGKTPLHCAANSGHKEIVELLIANGADVNAKNDEGWTNLHMAATAGGGYGTQFHIFELLIAKGAEVNAIIKLGWFEGRTPLDMTRGIGRGADLLRKHGAKTGAELSIHIAAKKGDIEAVKQHLTAGEDVNAKNDAERKSLN